ncbi:hypothetical protein BGZ81_001953 [Podila clonocystis]|nr:hypothetical protein BGZ81_001953 [Podila clonocystis]
MIFKLSFVSSVVVVMAVAMATADAYQLWYRNKGSNSILKKDIAGNKCVRLKSVSKTIVQIVPNTEASTGCKYYSDLKCKRKGKGFNPKGSVYCYEP